MTSEFVYKTVAPKDEPPLRIHPNKSWRRKSATQDIISRPGVSSSIVWLIITELPLKLDEAIQEAAQSMERDLSTGMSFWAVVAIVCNSVVGVLILILFVILYKACKVPSHQDKLLMFEARREPKAEQKYRYILTTA